MQKYILLLSLIGIYPIAFAAIDPSGSYGDAGDYLFELAPGAQAYAKGGGSATDHGVDAIYRNPAGISMTDFRQIEVGRMWLTQDFLYTTLSMVYPLDKAGAVGASFIDISPAEPVAEYAWDGAYIGTRSGGERAIALTYAWAYQKKFALGTSFKLASQNVGALSGWGFGFDAGLQWKVTSWLALGTSLVNVYGPSITLDQVPDDYATVFQSGALFSFLQNRIQVALDLGKANIFEANKRSNRFQASLQGSPFDWVFLRAGINDRQHTYGAGLSAGPIRMDYGVGIPYRDLNNDLGLSHFVSIHWDIGKPLPIEKKELTDSLNFRRNRDLLDHARAQFLQEQFADASESIDAYLKKMPTDVDALQLRLRIRASLNADQVRALQTQFHADLLAKAFDDASAKLQTIIKLNSQYDSISSMQASLLLVRESEDKLNKADSLDMQSQWAEIQQLAADVLARNAADLRAKELLEKVMPFVRAGQARQLYAEASNEFHNNKEVEKAHQLLLKALDLHANDEEIVAFHEQVSKALREFYLKQVGLAGGSAEQLGKLVQLDVSDRVLQARKLLKANDWKNAEVEILKALQQDPNNTYALTVQEEIISKRKQFAMEEQYQEALRFYNKGDRAACANLLSSVLATAPNDEKSLTLRKDLVESSIQLAREKFTAFQTSNQASMLQEAVNAIAFLENSGLDTEDSKQMRLEIATELEVIEILKWIEKGELGTAETKLNEILMTNPDHKSAGSAFRMLMEMKEIMK